MRSGFAELFDRKTPAPKRQPATIRSDTFLSATSESSSLRTPLMRIRRLLTASAILILVGILCACGATLVVDWPRRMGMIRPMGAALVVLLLLRRFENQRPQIALAFLSSLAGLYFVELTFSLARAHREGWKPSNSDTRLIFEIVADLRESGTNAYLAWFKSPSATNDSGHTDLISLSGVSQAVTVLPNENGCHPIYLSDEFGFNNPSGWSEWPPGKAIALVGDSFVHGYSVEQQETIAARLNARMPGNTNRAVSAALAGMGPLASLGVTVEYLRPLKPRYVIWCYYEGNDLSELRREAQSGLAQYLHDMGFSQKLWNRQSEVDEHESRRLDSQIAKRLKKGGRKEPWSWRWLFLGELRSRMSYCFRPPRFPVEKRWLPVFSQVLGRAKAEVESWGGELIFIYLPQFDRYHAPRQRDFKAMHSEVIGIVRDLRLPVIDLHREMFLAADDPLKYFPFRRRGHYNAAGYDKVAELIWKHLQPGAAVPAAEN